jgi:hypothetical protein
VVDIPVCVRRRRLCNCRRDAMTGRDSLGTFKLSITRPNWSLLIHLLKIFLEACSHDGPPQSTTILTSIT